MNDPGLRGVETGVFAFFRPLENVGFVWMAHGKRMEETGRRAWMVIGGKLEARWSGHGQNSGREAQKRTAAA